MPDPTATARLGHSDVLVSRLGIGTAPLAGLFQTVSDADAHDVVRQGVSNGIRLFDTAPHYGAGLAEQRLGAGIAGLPREDLVISSKVGRVLRRGEDQEYHATFKDAPSLHPEFDFSERGVLESFEQSCARLGVDRLDVAHIHDPDDHGDQALAETFPTLERLKSEGKIGAISAGMNQTEMLVRFAREAAFDCFLVAGRYTLLDQSAARELLPLCLQHGISIIIGGVFNSGLLADPDTTPYFDYAPAAAEMVERARRIRQVCDRYGVPLAAAAVQFPLGHPAVASVLVGVRSAAEVAADLDLFRWPIPAELWGDLTSEGFLDAAVPSDRLG